MADQPGTGKEPMNLAWGGAERTTPKDEWGPIPHSKKPGAWQRSSGTALQRMAHGMRFGSLGHTWENEAVWLRCFSAGWLP